MELPIQISAKGVELTPEQDRAIRAAVAKLARFFPRLLGSRVVVSVPNRRPTGEPMAWEIRLTLEVPGRDIAISRQVKPSLHQALDEAVSAGRRQLKDFAQELRGDVKLATEETRGRVTGLFTYEGYGFLEAADGAPVYFHRNSVPGNGFDRLMVGMEVRYVATEGEKGLQASTVLPLERPAVAVGSGTERGTQ